MADEIVPSKPGYKTSEFWLSSLVVVCGLLVASGIIPTGGPWDKALGLVMSALSTMGYTASRGNVKANS